MNNERHYSPDVAERTGLDEGFSDGWGAHFPPNERYWIDTHMHVAEHSEWAVRQALGQYFQRTAAFRLDQIIVLDGTPETLDTYAAVAKTDRRFHFMIWPKPDQPDPDFVRRAHKAGSLGMKLHNGPIMRGLQDWKVWESDAWREVFEVCRELRFPILWHVTQRLSTSPYTGGGPGTYWKDGKEKGVKFTNADLLEQFLGLVDQYPEVTWIGAHQLHVGNAKLDELFTKHRNLVTDTSCGYFVRFGDQMFPEDAAAARAFLCKWSDRILFGTDCTLGVAESNEIVFQGFLGHVRYLRQAGLPHDVLQRIAWENAAKLFNLPDGIDRIDFNVRP